MLGIHLQTLLASYSFLQLAGELQINVLCINSSKAFTLARGHISRPENGFIPVLSQPPGLVSVVRALPNPSSWSPSTVAHLNPLLGWLSDPIHLANSIGPGPAEQGCLYLSYLPPSSQAL